LLCLARALLRRNRIIALDEATASLDYETDKMIQETIWKEFSHATVITIAHRINTIINYDKILVLQDGVLLEYGAPQELLLDPTSHFYFLANVHHNK